MTGDGKSITTEDAAPLPDSEMGRETVKKYAEPAPKSDG